jgi:hypothetical protein
MQKIENGDDSPIKRRRKWRIIPYLFVIIVVSIWIAMLFNGGAFEIGTISHPVSKIALKNSDPVVDLPANSDPAPPWVCPASVNGGECYPEGVQNWADEYQPPAFFLPPETRRQRMIREIIGIWRLFFKDEAVKPEDPRWSKIPIYAAQLTDAITIYQETETDRGGRLPVHDSTHRIMAVMVTLETALRAKIQRKSRQREVGLMQVHGHALAGYSRARVRRTPFLGLLLGARWVAVSINECLPDGFDDQSWELTSWFGPLSAYGAGSGKAKRDDGTCKTFPIAIARVNLVRMYMKRIKNGER